MIKNRCTLFVLTKYFRLLHFIPGNYAKNIVIFENKWTIGRKNFRDGPLTKSNEWTGRVFEPQHKLFLLTSYQKLIPKYIFFNQN